MSKSRSRPQSPLAVAEQANEQGDHLLATADALFRFANECCRQHRRYARLIDRDVDESEQEGALRLVETCDALLAEMIEAYAAAARGQSRNGDLWWHRANGLWQASREFARRHSWCDRSSRELSAAAPSTLARLALEYDLEASALLLLHQAIDAYREARPEAELKGSNGRHS